MIALFALVAIESNSQSLGRTYAALLFCALLLDISWFILFTQEIWYDGESYDLCWRHYYCSYHAFWLMKQEHFSGVVWDLLRLFSEADHGHGDGWLLCEALFLSLVVSDL